jgi:hypothetical protein
MTLNCPILPSSSLVPRVELDELTGKENGVGQVYPELDDRLVEFIGTHPMFFVATAPCLDSSGNGGTDRPEDPHTAVPALLDHALTVCGAPASSQINRTAQFAAWECPYLVVTGG